MGNAKKLLYVEDEVIIALDTAERLKGLGYEVMHVPSGEKAVDIIEESVFAPDLILLDIDLGKGMDGTQAARRILRTHDIPILFLSSHTEKDIVEKTEEITSYGYVVKNSGIVVLDASIKMAFRLFDAHREINRKNMVIKAGNENLRITIEKLEETNARLVKMEKELVLQMERYKHAQKIGLIGNWEYDIEKGTVWGSEEALRIYNLPPGTNNLHLDQIEAMDHDRDRMNKALMDLIKYGKKYDLEFKIKPYGWKDWKWLHSVAELQKDKDGKPVKVAGVVQDISKQKSDQEALRKLNQAVCKSSDIILILDREGIITFMTPRFTEIYGYTEDEILNRATPGILNYDPIPEEQERKFWKDLNDSLQVKTEFRNRSKSGKLIYVEAVVDALIDDDGEVTGFLEIQRDITDRKTAEKKLAESEESLSITLQSIGDGVLATDLSGIVTRINAVAERLTGWKAEKALGEPLSKVFNIINADTGKQVDNPVDKVLKTGVITGLANHTVLISRDGTRYQIEDSAAPIKDPSGNIRGVILVFHDVTEKYRQENENRRIQILFKAVFDVIPDGAVITDEDNRIRFVNRGMKSIFGYDPEELIGHELSFLYSEKLRYGIAGPDVSAIGKAGSLVRYVSRFKDKSGRIFTGETIRAGLYVSGGEWIGNLEIIKQVSSRDNVVDDLYAAKERAERRNMENEVLMREVHHRIKNHMNTVRGLLALQADSIENSEASEALKKAENRIYAMMLLYDRLYMSDEFTSVAVRNYLPALIEDVVDSLSFSNCRVYTHVEIEDFRMDGGKLALLGIIINELITNSVKYAFTDKSSGNISVRIFCKGSDVHVVTCDDGSGIPEHVVRGTEAGFGLKLVSMLTEQLNGELYIDNKNGACITLVFNSGIMEDGSRGSD